jgi:hypothetical protein
VVGQIAEVSGFEGEKILMQDVGIYKDGKVHFTGLVPRSMAELVATGLPQDFFVNT